MFNIITITCGRPLYLTRLLESIEELAGDQLPYVKHFIYFQNDSYTPDILNCVSSEYRKIISVKERKDVIGVGEVLNEILPHCSREYTIKLDDDAVLRSPDFLTHAKEIIALEPKAVFSPFPVGLINNLGGVPSKEHVVKFGTETNTFYTFRKVNHIGGFARIAPTDMLKSVTYSSAHNEDAEFSEYCRRINVPMYYMENALIVEHQESTLGQHTRYGKDYFKGRF